MTVFGDMWRYLSDGANWTGNDGIAALRPAGTAVLVGMGGGPEATVPLSLIQSREIWLSATFRYANTYPSAIALAASGQVDLDAIVTGPGDEGIAASLSEHLGAR